MAGPPPEPTTLSETGDGGLGSRAHVRATLDRVRGAIATSRTRRDRNLEVMARAELLAAESASRIRESTELREQLRASVAAYARRLFADGVAPQRMLVLVKEAVTESAPRELHADEVRELMADVVRWSINAYYAA